MFQTNKLLGLSKLLFTGVLISSLFISSLFISRGIHAQELSDTEETDEQSKGVVEQQATTEDTKSTPNKTETDTVPAPDSTQDTANAPLGESESVLTEENKEDGATQVNTKPALQQEQTAAVDSETGMSISPEDKAGEKPKAFQGALDEEPGFKVGAQLAGIWMLQNEYMTPANEFRVQRARVKFTFTQWKLIRAVLKIEAKELFNGNGSASILRDAYVRVQPVSWIGIRMGQFKKPFSRIALTSWNKFPMIHRGIGNDYISDHLMYGDRDIGAMLEGRIIESVKLDYAIGAFNGMGMNTRELGLDGSKDLTARLEIEPVKWLEIGAGASLKFIEDEDLPGFVNQNNFSLVEEDEYPNGYTPEDFIEEHEWMTGMAWMTGLDAAVKPGRWKIIAEGMLGENWWFEKYPYIWGAALMVSTKQPVKKGLSLWLEPVVKGEVLTFMTDGMKQWRSRLWQVSPGITLHLGKHVRFAVNGEFIFANGEEADIDGSRREGLWPNEYPGNWSSSQRLIVQLGFHI